MIEEGSSLLNTTSPLQSSGACLNFSKLVYERHTIAQCYGVTNIPHLYLCI